MLRTPLLPVQAELVENLQELKQAIRSSSEDFYGLIKDCGYANLDQLPTRVKYTLWKYFNRARYRSTPFASFGAVSLVKLSGLKSLERIVIDRQQRLRTFADWSTVPDAPGIYDADEPGLLLFTNSSYYFIKDKIRAITCHNQQFQISEFMSSELVLKILKLCDRPVSIQQVMNSLSAEEIRQVHTEDLLNGMIQVQLLLSSRQQNIIGRDYLRGLIPQVIAEKRYVIADREHLSGNIKPVLVKHLVPMIKKLAKISQGNVSLALSNFASRFYAKFGDREIPLMQALDIESGVGYDDLEMAAEDQALFPNLDRSRIEEPGDQQIKNMLLSTLTSGMESDKDGIDLAAVKTEGLLNVHAFPNTFNVMAVTKADDLWIQSIGGSTANAIFGRFSLEDEQWTEACRNIANIEQQANPDVILFDVGYTGDPHTDNINRRASIYAYELNILNFDYSEDPILISDIMVHVRAGKVFLRSQRLNKRLVPKIASAYNYKRSDLSLFRFLCDLQSQEILTHLAVDLQQIVPGLSFYPKVYFGNIILAPAKWLIKLDDVNMGSGDRLEEFVISHFMKRAIPFCFKAGSSDQTLYFDLDSSADTWAFSQYLKKNKAFYISEVAVATGGGVDDQNGNSYHEEYVFTLHHDSEIHQGIAEESNPIYVADHSIIPPGGNWLYFEIYCHPNYMNNLILEVIKPLMANHMQNIKNWFFVRYNENGDHLRLRIQLHDPCGSQRIIADLAAMLRCDLELGVVSDFLIKTYKRESQRYQALNIERVESHFCFDSNFVSSILPSEFSSGQLYKLIELALREILKSGVIARDALTAWVDNASESYNAEFELKPSDFKLMNQAFEDYKRVEIPQLAVCERLCFDKFTASFIKCLHECKDLKREQLFADFMHMHFNRLFPNRQREHEMNFYFLMTKMKKFDRSRRIIH